MESNRLTLSDNIAGHDPELVIVFEVNATLAEFRRAAELVPGLEFLAELVDEAEEPEFGIETARPGQLVDKTLYVIAQNARALQEILGLWQRWQREAKPQFARGLAPWKQIFALLKDVRPWGPSDRIGGTQLSEVWTELISAGDEEFVAEIELWFRNTQRSRDAAQTLFLEELRAAGAAVLDIAQIESIAYHAVLIRLNRRLAIETLSGEGFLAQNAKISQVRPQMLATDRLSDPEVHSEGPTAAAPSLAEPVVAILDGVPLTGHRLLRGRLQFDDPADIARRVEASDRTHGSAIASLVIWGDLERGRGDALGRKVYVHPIFTSENSDGVVIDESMPSDRLPVAVIDDILRRMFLGTNGEAPVAPKVRIVVLAAGHTALPFGSKMSPWGRLLDVYASRFNILFIVSAGNYPLPIELDESVESDVVDDPEHLQRAVREHIFKNAHERRILSPADSLNALTVGALHADSVSAALPETVLDVIGPGFSPSPTSAIGGGYLRQMKPDVFADGGRVFYRHRFDRVDKVILDRLESSDAAPGLLTAAPGQPGDIAAEAHLQGTSVAAAFVAHEASQVLELLVGDGTDGLVEDRYLAVATKALVVNSAAWLEAGEMIGEALSSSDRGAMRRDASRLLGFGFVRPDEIASCHTRKITMIATGTVLGGQARLLEIPVPPSLNGRRDIRTVATTLAWFTPVNPRQKSYRQARVWFDIANESTFGIAGSEGEHRATRRGSIQHEVLVGAKAVTVGKDAVLKIRVNCMESAKGLTGAVPFAIAVTFEVADSSPVRVYEEIADALRARATVRGARARVR
jgi:hypothetical protein